MFTVADPGGGRSGGLEHPFFWTIINAFEWGNEVGPPFCPGLATPPLKCLDLPLVQKLWIDYYSWDTNVSVFHLLR